MDVSTGRTGPSGAEVAPGGGAGPSDVRLRGYEERRQPSHLGLQLGTPGKEGPVVAERQKDQRPGQTSLTGCVPQPSLPPHLRLCPRPSSPAGWVPQGRGHVCHGSGTAQHVATTCQEGPCSLDPSLWDVWLQAWDRPLSEPHVPQRRARSRRHPLAGTCPGPPGVPPPRSPAFRLYPVFTLPFPLELRSHNPSRPNGAGHAGSREGLEGQGGGGFGSHGPFVRRSLRSPQSGNMRVRVCACVCRTLTPPDGRTQATTPTPFVRPHVLGTSSFTNRFSGKEKQNFLWTEHWSGLFSFSSSFLFLTEL